MASRGGLAADDESRYEDGEEDGDEDEEDMMSSGRPYVPPATDRDGPKPSFGEQCDSQFIVPARLHDKPYELIEAANDWHYAMMNDHPRNDFYRGALAKVVTSPHTLPVSSVHLHLHLHLPPSAPLLPRSSTSTSASASASASASTPTSASTSASTYTSASASTSTSTSTSTSSRS